MIAGVATVVANLGVSFETMILLVVGVGGLLFYAKDVKLGLVMHVLIFASIFIWFYQAGHDWHSALILFFMALVLMSLTLYALHKSKENPYGVY